MFIFHSLAFTTFITLIFALPPPYRRDDQPYAYASTFRNLSQDVSNPLIVDLGYDIYEGTSNSTTGVNSWKGIRFAAAPIGKNRWQIPQAPNVNRSKILPASEYGPQCPQSGNSKGTPVQNGITGNEDCLVLNVNAPMNVTHPLPVLVFIHGGGYGELYGRLDFTDIMNANNNSFIGVAIQYRLGAFGFLSSQEVYDNGVVNAGIYDQYLALQWVQQYIASFGGDPCQVTISGESAGGGSIMLLDIAYGGAVGTTLFENSIAASPFLPMQQIYNSSGPTLNYNAFVDRAGCSSYAGSKFDCLVSASTEVLQNASSYVSTGGPYGTWAFLPVTDGSLIQDLPSRALAAKKVNGQRMLSGNNALEGSNFVPQNLTTEADVVAWLRLTFSMLSNADIQAVLAHYPIEDANITAASPRFATDGTMNPNANEVSPVATGQQQRANNIYGETTFVCPSYWLAEAYIDSDNMTGSTSYKYQYSVIPSLHGQDVAAYFSPPSIPHSPDFSLAFKQIWGNFVTTSNPSISNLVANGESTGNETSNPASSWPMFNEQTWAMMDLNETFTGSAIQNGLVYPATGIMNDITLVDAYTWEAGRGARCEFWRSIGASVPERK